MFKVNSCVHDWLKNWVVATYFSYICSISLKITFQSNQKKSCWEQHFRRLVNFNIQTVGIQSKFKYSLVLWNGNELLGCLCQRTTVGNEI